ncbi:succinate dehydrogenase cytochrome b subunit [Crocinitomix catalasitica]|uniref:succinate dehydrogenase cytochrome b subunit n=1 Tax=Crocinitomix catalasitica TaxID=184607 RepID=UPI00048305C7|nr:succinate dehydrogenase cytochrome b subunit [Crocinitomix catalasitica]
MKTSIARKVLMALSGFFLLLFLLQHFVINFSSVISVEGFNKVSHFMGTNPIIQYGIQPILLIGVLFHLGMGIYLDVANRKARNVKYAMNKPGENSSWWSRNMIITGITIMLFLGLHFYDFWFPEINTKFILGDMSGLNGHGEFRYWEELHHKFVDPIRVGIYCLSFVFLALHLLHGFQSAFQSVGFNHTRYTPVIKKLGNIYAICIPLGFIFIAVYHYVSQ